MKDEHWAPSVILVVGAAVAAALLAVGAELAAFLKSGRVIGAPLSVVLRSAFVALAHTGDPRRGWPQRFAPLLPGPVGYWGSTTLVVVTAGGFAVIGADLYRRLAGGTRRRFGVEASARLARRSELRQLIIARPTPGRFVLGRIGRWRLATEDAEAANFRPRFLIRGRIPHLTSVAMIGPTRCGKTAAAITGVLQWIGPAILSSVKSDLMTATIEARRRMGEVRIFDPSGLTAHPTAGWSPLRAAHTVPGAQQAARELVDAGPRRGGVDLDFFLRLAEQVLWPHFFFAANYGRSMRTVVDWILTQESPLSPDGEAAPRRVV